MWRRGQHTWTLGARQWGSQRGRDAVVHQANHPYMVYEVVTDVGASASWHYGQAWTTPDPIMQQPCAPTHSLLQQLKRVPWRIVISESRLSAVSVQSILGLHPWGRAEVYTSLDSTCMTAPPQYHACFKCAPHVDASEHLDDCMSVMSAPAVSLLRSAQLSRHVGHKGDAIAALADCGGVNGCR